MLHCLTVSYLFESIDFSNDSGPIALMFCGRFVASSTAVPTTAASSCLPESSEDFDLDAAIVRPIRADDAEGLIRFHHLLSDTSIRRRYFYPHLDLGVEEVAHLTQVDGTDR